MAAVAALVAGAAAVAVAVELSRRRRRRVDATPAQPVRARQGADVDADAAAHGAAHAETPADAGATTRHSSADDAAASLYRVKAAVAKDALASLDLDVERIARESNGELFGDRPADRAPLARVPIHARVPFGFYVDGVLSERECALLVERTVRSGGFSFWSPDPDQRAFRDCETLEVNHPQLAALLWRRLEPAMRGGGDHDDAIDDLTRVRIESQEQDPVRYARDLAGEWVAYGTNACVLFSQYREGGHFAAHTDGFNVLDFDDRSMFSVVLYLNSLPEGAGGQTTFYEDRARDSIARDAAGRLVADEALAIASVRPVAGRACCFFHNTMHQSVVLAPGSGQRKWIIRSDVMYRRNPPLLVEERDRRAYELIREAERVAETDPDQAAALYRRAFKTSWLLGGVYGM